MLDELMMIKDIVGDLSAVGGWVAGGVILYKFISTMVFYVGGGYLVKFLATLIAEHLKSDISREEADSIKSENTRIRGELRGEELRHSGELAEIKALYKILKESKNESE